MNIKNLLFLSLSTIAFANNYNPKYDLQLAKEYYKKHQTNLAITYFNKVLIHQPHNPTANLYLYKIYKPVDKQLANYYFNQIKKPSQKELNEIAKSLNITNYLKNTPNYTFNNLQEYIHPNNITKKNNKYSPQNDIQKGKQYLKENKLNLAIASFEKVLMYQPHNETANLYLSKIFSNIDPKLANHYLKNIKKPIKHYSVLTMFGIGYDNNINNDSTTTKWDVYVDGEKKTITHTPKKDDAISIYEFIKINPKTSLFNTKIINNLSLYNKNVINYHDKNIQVFSYSPTILNKNKKYYFKYIYVRYSDDSYLNKFRFGETIYTKYNKNQFINKFMLTYNNYLADGKVSKDYLDYRLDSLFSHKHNSFLFSTITSGELAKRVGGNKADEFGKFKIGGGINYSINSYKFGTKIAYSYKRYEQTNQTFQKKQTDQKTVSTFIIEKKIKTFNHNFNIQTKIKYTDNKSNIKAYSYNKFQVSFNIIKKFKVFRQ